VTSSRNNILLLNGSIYLFYYCIDGNVNQLLPLVEEYQILAVKKKCEEFLLTKTGSMELLITGMLFLYYSEFFGGSEVIT